MGRRVHAPYRGSHGFYPRVRASSILPRVRSWPKLSGSPRLLGFPMFKVGMTHVIKIDTYELSPLYGQEVAKAITVLEAPAIFGVGVRLYGRNLIGGLESIGEAIYKDLPEYAFRRLPKIKKEYNFNKRIEILRSKLDEVERVRLLALTRPFATGIGKKTPDLVEIEVGGEDLEKVFDYAVSLVGKLIRFPTPIDTERERKKKPRNRFEKIEIEKGYEEVFVGVFDEGQLVDVIGVTKGKGFQGVIKRFGVKIPVRWHKHRKGHRHVGSAGPATPGTIRQIPMPGQMGFHRRTEYNKRLLSIGYAEEADKVNPKSGWLHYGIVRNDYAIIEGSVMGPQKRMLMIRHPIRPSGKPLKLETKLVYISGVM